MKAKITYLGPDVEVWNRLRGLEELRNVPLHWITNTGHSAASLILDDFQVVLLDLDLGAERGIDLLREIRQYHAGIPVLVLASVDDLVGESLAAFSLRAADGVFLKPLDETAKLLDGIDHGLHQLDHWRQWAREQGHVLPSTGPSCHSTPMPHHCH